MASISKDKNGTKRIVYYNADKRQECIRLGDIPLKDAQTIKVHVENLLAAQAMRVSVAAETADWLSRIPDVLYMKFVQKGFVEPRRVVGTLGEMLPNIIKEKAIGNTKATADIYGQAEASLYKYFGEDRKVDTVTATNAKEYSLWLAKHGRLKQPGGLAPKTVSKRMQHAFSFFERMVEKEIIPSNPFKGLVQKVAVDDRRNRYIDEETILKVMEYAPDAEWRLIIALWRFAGLRAVSEVLTLKWEDILWDQKEMMVRSPKTEHCGKGIRRIPFFPHIEECLIDAAEQADEGAVYVVEKHAPLYLRGKKERTYISRQGNIGTRFRKIILKAGVVPWGKLIHNLRASFETDLLNGECGQIGIHTIANWLGHSVQVMLQHYGRHKQSDLDQIANARERVKRQKEQPTECEGRYETVHYISQPMPSMSFTAGDADPTSTTKASLNASLYTAVSGGIWGTGAESPFSTDSQHALENKAHEGKNRQETASCASSLNYRSGGQGIRTLNRSPGN